MKVLQSVDWAACRILQFYFCFPDTLRFMDFPTDVYISVHLTMLPPPTFSVESEQDASFNCYISAMSIIPPISVIRIRSHLPPSIIAFNSIHKLPT